MVNFLISQDFFESWKIILKKKYKMKKEKKERHPCFDPRVFKAIEDAKKSDNSFTEKGFLGILPTYKQVEVRKAWFDAMELGMIEGIKMGSIKGQRIDLHNSVKEPRQKEFLDKFFKLCDEYNCAVLYHPVDGMCIIDLKPQPFSSSINTL